MEWKQPGFPVTGGGGGWPRMLVRKRRVPRTRWEVGSRRWEAGAYPRLVFHEHFLLPTSHHPSAYSPRYAARTSGSCSNVTPSPSLMIVPVSIT